MNKIKFIMLMALIILLYQIPFLIDNYSIYVYMFLTALIWILGTKKIKKDSIFKKVVIYGFLILWYLLVFILINTMKKNSYFFLEDDFWIYSPVSLFVISKILTINTIKNKIEKNNKYLIILSIIIFIVGFLITHTIYNVFDENVPIVTFIYQISNITIIIIQLFNIFKITLEEKLSTILTLTLTIIIILIANIIPIQQINKCITLQEKVCNIIHSNTLTYKNISAELEPYVLEGITSQKDTGIIDHRFFTYMNGLNMRIIKTWIDEANIQNFDFCLTNIKNSANVLSEFIVAEKQDFNYRLIGLSTSIVLIIIIGIFVLLGKEKLKEQY